MNIYLISNESYRLINDEIKKIVKNNNYFIFNMNRTNIADIITEANYFSLTDEKKYLVVTNASFFGTGKLSDAENDLIISYLEKPNPNTILIFTTQDGIDSRKKIVKLIKDNGHLIVQSKLDKKSINALLTNYLKKKGFNSDYQTINYIMDNSYGSIDIMFNELDKIMIYYGKSCTFKYSDVTSIVGEEHDSNNFHFVDAVIKKDLKVH